MTRPNGHLWQIYAIQELNNFLLRKACILMKRRVVKSKGIEPVLAKWAFKSKKEADGLIRLKS